jgi:hypothetical protein
VLWAVLSYVNRCAVLLLLPLIEHVYMRSSWGAVAEATRGMLQHISVDC